MSFRILLYLVVLAPFAVLGIVNGVSLQHVIAEYEAALERDREVWAEATTRNIAERLNGLEKATISLSRPSEIVYAVESADNEVLFDWGESFIGGIDTVIFTDPGGIVLARAPDEFRFGDSLKSSPFFAETMATGDDRGIAVIDGRDSFFACRTVQKYGDIAVGVVCVSAALTPILLEHMVPVSNMVASVVRPDGYRISPAYEAKHRAQLGLTMNGYSFELGFAEDERFTELMDLKRSLYLNGALVGVATLVLLLAFARWQFAPYATLVKGIVEYSSRKIDLEALRDRLLGLGRNPGSEIARISAALVGMIDVLRENLLRIESLNAHLRELASKDPLTQLLNRRALDDAIGVETQRARRYHSPLSILMLDLDRFKEINDTRGHEVGDKVLARLAGVLTENSRATDICGRWGGEEFMILCPGNSLTTARIFAEKLRRRIEQVDLGDGVSITASIGIAEYIANEPPRELIARADIALYDAKAAGRNVVRIAGMPTASATSR